MNDPLVPLVDLSLQHWAIAEEIAAPLAEVMATGAFIGGPHVSAFEHSFAQLCGRAQCVGVGNGTDALELALRAAGLAPGDEVIVPVNTFTATAEAVIRAGARPVLVDVDPVHLLIDPEAVADALGPRTRAIVPVHLFGQMAPIGPLRALAQAHDLMLVEDAAQAQGASQHGRTIGWGTRAAATSFYPGKNLGAYGDAGAVLTDDAPLAARVRRIANHGSESRYHHVEPGFNSRLDAIQAVVLHAKLTHLPAWNTHRQLAAQRYHELLCGLERVELPSVVAGNEHVWHLYVVRLPERDRVLTRMQAAGIGVGVHYPVPLHQQPAFAHLGHRQGEFPVAETAAERILSLPIYPGIALEQQELVASALAAALGAARPR